MIVLPKTAKPIKMKIITRHLLLSTHEAKYDLREIIMITLLLGYVIERKSTLLQERGS